MSELAEVADDMVVIGGGQIRASGTMSEVTQGFTSLEEAFFTLTAPTSASAAISTSSPTSESGR